MRIDIISIFPEIFEPTLGSSMLGIARDITERRRVDDRRQVQEDPRANRVLEHAVEVRRRGRADAPVREHARQVAQRGVRVGEVRNELDDVGADEHADGGGHHRRRERPGGRVDPLREHFRPS